MSASFTWKPLYRELAEKVLQFRDKQEDLVTLLKDLDQQGLKVINIEDKFADGSRGDLKEIDPFTFFATFNRGTSDENRRAILTELEKRWALSAAIPDDFDGIPVMNSMNSWFIRYAENRDSKAVSGLWQLAECVVRAKSIEDVPATLIDNCLRPSKGNLTSLTMGMFWFNPALFPALDWKNQSYADKAGVKWDEENQSGAAYLAWVKAVTTQFGSDPGAFSLSAQKIATASDVESLAPQPPRSGAHRVWALAAGEHGGQWETFHNDGYAGLGWNEVGDLGAFANKNAIDVELQKKRPSESRKTNDSLALWEFSREIQVGDIIIAKSGVNQILGVGIVTGPYFYAADATPHSYRHRRNVEWKVAGKWTAPGAPFARKTLTDVTHKKDLFEWMGAVTSFSMLRPIPTAKAPAAVEEPPASYSRAMALEDLFMQPAQFDHLLGLLVRKKNLILMGPPGVGKTYAAKRLAWAAMGERDKRRLCMVQFHPSYSYEDFVQGLRPNGSGFSLKNGIFYDFCRRASADIGKPYFFVIDEINRGQPAKVFGELMMLIEPDKRGPDYAIPLMYSSGDSDDFYVPENVHFIGTMNTADRSLSLVDYALRRRFAFVKLDPAFDSPGFENQLARNRRSPEIIAKIRTRLGALNKSIADDTRNLGEGFQIGHSFFCTAGGNDNQWFQDIVTFEVQPLLEEYWIDQPKKAAKAVAELIAP